MSKGRHSKPNEHTSTMKKVALAATVSLGAVVVPATFAGTASAASTTVWDRLASCESGGDFTTNTGNGYYGGFQFSLSTWRSVGGSGNPADASPAEQLRLAKILLAAEGPGQWSCSTMSGELGYVGLTKANGAAEGLTILGGSSTTPPPSTTPPASTGTTANAAKAIKWAVDHANAHDLHYVFGGEGPTGYDCSSFVQAAWRSAGVSIGRDTYEQDDTLPHVDQSSMRPGDLILWNFQGTGQPSPNHVTMYIGGGQMVEASGSRGIVVDNVSGRGGQIVGVVRPDSSASVPSTPPPTTPPPADNGGGTGSYPEGGKHYTVKAGDTLSKIASEQNVRGGWKALYEANKDAIGSDPNLIHVGEDLILPNPDAYDSSGLPEPGHTSPSAVPLQKELKRGGYMASSVVENANYGPLTQAAVAKFHNAHTEFRSAGVSHDVKIGPKGWAFLLGLKDSTPAPSTPKPSTPAPSADYVKPVDAPIGTPYHQSGSMWSLGYHTGVDFLASTGDPVHAVAAGTVVVAADNAGSYGTHVIIKHADGKYSLYAHFSSRSVNVGESVKAGEVIGAVGATGNVTGPHLHFEIRTSVDFGSDVDPIAYLEAHGVNF